MRRIFLDNKLESDISAHGYTVIKNFVPSAISDKLKAVYDQYGQDDARAFTISNWSTNEVYRREAYIAITDLLLPRSNEFLDNYRPAMAVYTAKRPGENSDMLLHQDWSLVDESKYRSLSVWVALCDMDTINGNLQVADKSHIYAGMPRGMNVHVPFEDIRGELQKRYMDDVPLSKGDAIIFDHRLIHCSPINQSDKIRLAAVMAMIPQESELIHYYYDPGKENELEMLEMEQEDFLMLNFFDVSGKPKHVKSLGFIPYEFKKVRLYDVIGAAEGKRFDFPFFKDNSIQQQIASNGYSVQPLLSADEVVQLNQDFKKLLELMNEPLPDKHWTSGRVEDITLRNFARQAIDRIVPQALERYFDPERTDMIGGIFLAKKPSPISELSAHQDSSHTDERIYPAVYAWVALCDTTLSNGAMHVLPGSHLWGNRHRSLNVPWLFAGMEKSMAPYLTALPMKAGEVLFFDSAAIHYSSNNMSSEIRPALNFFVKPKDAPFLHHYIDEQTPEKKVEVYNVDIDFFYNYDFMQRPPCPPYRKLGIESRIESISPETLEKLMKSFNSDV